MLPCPGQPSGPEHVNLEQVTQIGISCLLHRTDMRTPGLVDQHVAPTVAADDVSDRGLDGIMVITSSGSASI